MTRIIISDQAEADLIDLWLYIAEDSIDAADRFVSQIHEKCRLLGEAPEMGRERAEIRKGIRSFPVGNYLIFYRIGDKSIEVARVISGLRDILSLFRR